MKHQILVCDRAGIPHHWADWKSSVILKVKDCISYEMSDASVFYGGNSRMTGLRSQIDVGQIIFLKEVLKYDSRVPPLTNQNLFARDRNICGYCGRHYSTHKLSRDHIIPTSKGGKDVWENCITSCKACNHAKGNLLLEDTDMELIFLPYRPVHAEKLILDNRNILADQLAYLSAMLPEHSRVKLTH